MVGSNDAPKTVTITRPWQLTFIGGVVAAQALFVGTMLWSFTRHGTYISAGTWVWQVTTWVYPLLYVAAGYAFVMSRVRGLVPRLFWSVFLATIGYFVYAALGMPLNYIRSNVFNYTYSNDPSLWSAFGWDWSVMAALFALFCLSLLVIRLRKRA